MRVFEIPWSCRVSRGASPDIARKAREIAGNIAGGAAGDMETSPQGSSYGEFPEVLTFFCNRAFGCAYKIAPGSVFGWRPCVAIGCFF